MRWWWWQFKRKPMINKEFFYKCSREKLLLVRLRQDQVDSINTVLNYWDESGYTDLRWLAYMMATIYHETAKTMLPIEEYGKGKGRTYGEKIKRSGVSYESPHKIYYGRGYVQLTWYENYELMSRLLFGDKRLLVEPELALDAKVAVRIMFEGMTKGSSSFGDFTGRCLEQYINEHMCDYVSARKIINGTDKQALIADYAVKFESCIKVT